MRNMRTIPAAFIVIMASVSFAALVRTYDARPHDAPLGAFAYGSEAAASMGGFTGAAPMPILIIAAMIIAATVCCAMIVRSILACAGAEKNKQENEDNENA